VGPGAKECSLTWAQDWWVSHQLAMDRARPGGPSPGRACTPQALPHQHQVEIVPIIEIFNNELFFVDHRP
jgi:hypothetical protein